jgi:hypothetical protein
MLALASVGFSQTWTPLKNQPTFAANDALLLTDGRVIVQDTNASDWWTLTPDNTGSYVNGTWKQVASLQSGYAPLYHAAAILPDGRLMIQGGEYNGGGAVWTNLGSIYDPVKNTWTPVNAPSGWSQIGDAQSVILNDGTFMLADPFNEADALLDATTLTYTVLSGTGKADRNDEEGWALLPDGKVLTVDALDAPNSELFDPSTKTWSSAGSTIVRLEDQNSEEIGPMVLRPNGVVFATGANANGAGHTSNYDTKTGEWTAGPDIPDGLDIADGPASLLPDGNVLIMASPGVYNNDVQFFEWNGTDFVDAPNIAGADGIPSYAGDMLVLPTGQVLLTTQGGTSPQVLVYTAKGTYKSAWRPTITSVAKSLTIGTKYVIKGTQFNGLSQGAAYGDDTQSATNYALVRITNKATKHVFYAKTINPSTMAVATGSKPVSTHFTVSSGTETGASTLVVVTNGIPSKAVDVTVEK